jgi:hypothetical protein
VSLRRYLPFLKSTLSPLRVLFKCTSLLGLEANTLVPKERLELSRLSATVSKTVMSTIPSLGRFSTDTRIRTLNCGFGDHYDTISPYPCVFEYKVGIEPTPLVLQTNRPPRSTYTFVSPTGLEPVTPSLKVRCSKPTELRRHFVRIAGFEPAIPCVQGR